MGGVDAGRIFAQHCSGGRVGAKGRALHHRERDVSAKQGSQRANRRADGLGAKCCKSRSPVDQISGESNDFAMMSTRPRRRMDRRADRSRDWHGWGGMTIPPATGRRCARRQRVRVVNGRQNTFSACPLSATSWKKVFRCLVIPARISISSIFNRANGGRFVVDADSDFHRSSLAEAGEVPIVLRFSGANRSRR